MRRPTFAILFLALIATGSISAGCRRDQESLPVTGGEFNPGELRDSEKILSENRREGSQPADGETLSDPFIPPVDLSDDHETVVRLPTIVSDRSGLNEFAQLSRSEADFTSDLRAYHHPHGKDVCSSGCALSNHPTPELSEGEFRRLVSRFATEPADKTSPSLESLLFFGRQAATYLDDMKPEHLDAGRTRLLRRELSRTHVRLAFRLVDEQGLVRTELPPTRVPLDRRHVFEMDVHGLPPLVASGTVKRVGLHHLWTRI